MKDALRDKESMQNANSAGGDRGIGQNDPAFGVENKQPFSKNVECFTYSIRNDFGRIEFIQCATQE